MKKDVHFVLVLILFIALVAGYFSNRVDLAPSYFVTDEPECGDTFDNDGDGAADFPADVECFADWDSSESLSGKCDEDWSCTQWSACVEGKQERTCMDANECGTDERKPAIERNCGDFLEESQESEGGGIYLIIAGLIVLALVIFLIVNKVLAKKDVEKVEEEEKALREKLKRKKKVYIGG